MSNLGTLRANVRRNLGQLTEADDSTVFYRKSELNQYISEAFKHYTIRENESGEGMFAYKTTLPLIANDESVDLSALDPPFMSVIRLQKNTSNGTIPLIENPLRFTGTSTLLVGTGDAYRPKWFLRGLKIILGPQPNTSETPSGNPPTQGLTLDYNYIPVFPTATSLDTFEFDASFPVVYEPMIELYATIAALETKDGMGGVSDISSFRERLAKWEEKFENSLKRSEYPDQVNYIGVDYLNPINTYSGR